MPISQWELIKAKLNFMQKENALSLSQENIINDQIASDQINPYKQQQQFGCNYYFDRADIISKKRTYWEDGVEKIDETVPNKKIQVNYFKLLIDQKVAYLVGKEPTITSSNPDHSTLINDLLGEEFPDIISDVIKNVSNKGVEYIMPYINAEGEFDYFILDSLEIIPIYDKWDKSCIRAFIRYYQVVNEKGEVGLQIEYWDDKEVTYYVKESNDAMVLFDSSREVNPQAHFTFDDGVNGVKGFGWGRCPIIEFRNNNEMLSDLTPSLKSLIDDYNALNSTVSDDLAELQQSVLVVQNYMGTDKKELKRDMKNNKVLLTGPEGGVSNLTVNIPIDSVEQTLQRRETDIFTTAQGVNTKNDIFNNAPSGVTLKQLYQSLDQKCSVLERKATKAIDELVSFITQFILIKTGVDYSEEDVCIKFNKQMLINQQEQIDMVTQSVGLLSKRTLLENHPWVNDVEEELRRIQAEEMPMTPPEETTQLTQMENMMEGNEDMEDMSQPGMMEE